MFQQLIAYDWHNLRPSRGGAETATLNYLALQSVRLSADSLKVVKELMEYTYQGEMPTHRNAQWFRSGDPFYGILLGLQELGVVQNLFSMFKHTFVSCMPSAVLLFRDERGDEDAPTLIWKVDKVEDELKLSTDISHYKSFEIAIAEKVVEDDYLKKDLLMSSLQKRCPDLTTDPSKPWPVPRHVVRFFKSIARQPDPPLHPQPGEQKDSNAPSPRPHHGSYDPGDMVWEDWLQRLSKSPSPMEGLHDDEVIRIQQQGLSADFDESLCRAISENEQQLSFGHPNPRASSSDTSASKRRKSHGGQ